MGEYVKHPCMKEENEIKIGVCRGDFWETYLPKKVLEELQKLGFKDFYAGEFDDNETGYNCLSEFINNYDKIDTSFVSYSELMEVEVDDNFFNLLKEKLIDEDIALVLFKNGRKIIVTDKRYVNKIYEIVQENNIEGVEIKEYQYSI